MYNAHEERILLYRYMRILKTRKNIKLYIIRLNIYKRIKMLYHIPRENMVFASVRKLLEQK